MVSPPQWAVCASRFWKCEWAAAGWQHQLDRDLQVGRPVLNKAGDNALGLIQGFALEQSNVAITQELVDLIVAQRNFQANAQVVQAEDAITQTIINMR